MLGEEIYQIRVVRGAMTDPGFLNQFPHKTIMEFSDPAWGDLLQIQVSLPELREVQKRMIRHTGESNAPWYADGWLEENPEVVVCAFGMDDGEDGRIFIFDRRNKESFEEVVDYGVSKGIPREQMDFLQ